SFSSASAHRAACSASLKLPSTSRSVASASAGRAAHASAATSSARRHDHATPRASVHALQAVGREVALVLQPDAKRVLAPKQLGALAGLQVRHAPTRRLPIGGEIKLEVGQRERLQVAVLAVEVVHLANAQLVLVEPDDLARVARVR